eukprot:CAMPEP_0113829184 /NCGR_PEP_ID=MMETSP0328-20130328/5665_1 /TAXON_ID=39455 /ORGANISM="Alexandrium minutum" /LENGTH=117 /DNA_ID=CAMNT_0000797223 /DNA_START=174 /DNA_END=527 /DNA_ORIENTATION=- /assembly_acc=CAM_ASM_000350
MIFRQASAILVLHVFCVSCRSSVSIGTLTVFCGAFVFASSLAFGSATVITWAFLIFRFVAVAACSMVRAGRPCLPSARTSGPATAGAAVAVCSTAAAPAGAGRLRAAVASTKAASTL